MVFTRLLGVRFLELILSVTCTVLHYRSLGKRDAFTNMLISGTFVGFSLILIVSAILGKNIDTFISLVGCVLFIICGVMIIQEWNSAFKTETRRFAITKGSLAIINGILFLFDVFFTHRG